MKPRALRPLGAPLFVLLAACSGSPKTTFHTLGVEAQGAATGTVSRYKSVGVGPVTLPALLEQPGVVLRKDDYTVELSPTHEWGGGKLEDELLRALTRYLRLRLPGVRVIPVPWETAQAPQVQLALAVDRFDGTPGKQAVLRGTWTLQNPADGSAVAAKPFALEQKVEGGNVGDLVQAQARLVAQLGEQVVAAIR